MKRGVGIVFIGHITEARKTLEEAENVVHSALGTLADLVDPAANLPVLMLTLSKKIPRGTSEAKCQETTMNLSPCSVCKDSAGILPSRSNLVFCPFNN